MKDECSCDCEMCEIGNCEMCSEDCGCHALGSISDDHLLDLAIKVYKCREDSYDAEVDGDQWVDLSKPIPNCIEEVLESEDLEAIDLNHEEFELIESVVDEYENYKNGYDGGYGKPTNDQKIKKMVDKMKEKSEGSTPSNQGNHYSDPTLTIAEDLTEKTALASLTGDETEEELNLLADMVIANLVERLKILDLGEIDPNDESTKKVLEENEHWLEKYDDEHISGLLSGDYFAGSEHHVVNHEDVYSLKLMMKELGEIYHWDLSEMDDDDYYGGGEDEDEEDLGY